ncbi:hypothetical protein [Luteolibacter soli]|uniref:HEAT repeat domain-containing protein n=1 Tax=Luteolibacter soli TaxID=3135280 RepID=A0ABU9AXW1_9BACT
MFSIFWAGVIFGSKRERAAQASVRLASSKAEHQVQFASEDRDRNPPKRVERSDKAPQKRKSVDAILAEFSGLRERLTGRELEQAQFTLIDEAKSSLRGEDALRFLEELMAHGSDNAVVYGIQMCAMDILLGDLPKGLELILAKEANPDNLKLARAAGYGVSSWGQYDVGKLLQGYPDSKLRDAIVAGYLQSRARSGNISAEDVRKFWTLVEQGLARNKDVYSTLAEAGKDTDFAGILAKATQLDEGQRAETSRAVVAGWSQENPAACAVFLKGQIGQLAGGDNQPAKELVQQVELLVTNWVPNNSRQAAEWVSSLPAGEFYDAGAGRLSMKLMSRNPEEGLAYASSISDPGLKRSALELSRDWASRMNDANLLEKVNGLLSTLPEGGEEAE